MVDPRVRGDVLVDAGLRVEFTSTDRRLIDATGGRLDLAPAALDVASLSLVDLPRSPGDVAVAVGLADSGGFRHGVRSGVLEPVDGQWRVAVLTVGDDAPTTSRIDVGRLSDRDAERWGRWFDGRSFRVVVFVEATPGFAGIEARFLRGVVEGTVPPASAVVLPTPDELASVAPPAAPAGWYVDPEDDARYRWWDAGSWTPHTSPR